MAILKTKHRHKLQLKEDFILEPYYKMKYENLSHNLTLASQNRPNMIRCLKVLFSCPFFVEASTVPENLQMELIDLQCNNEMKQIFTSTSAR